MIFLKNFFSILLKKLKLKMCKTFFEGLKIVTKWLYL